MHPGDHRVCFVGDSFTQGTGDATTLGWVGRIAAAACAAGWDLTAYNLGIRRDTSADIAARWQAECDARFRVECSPYIVFSFGANDMTAESDTLRVPIPESTAYFKSVISDAKARCPVLVVGPLPVCDTNQDVRIVTLCTLYAQLAANMNVPYLPLAKELAGNPAWRRAVGNGDGTHPDAEGYAMIAERVQQWPAWWFRA